MSDGRQDNPPRDPARKSAGATRFHFGHRNISGTEASDTASSAGRLRSTRREMIAGFLGGLFSFTLPRFAAAERRPRTVLAGVTGLEKRVTYCETKIPLGELVAKVAADTGVPLTAAPDVADEPVAVVVTDFPARELLEELAELLDYRWSRRGRDAGTAKRRGRQEDTETEPSALAASPRSGVPASPPTPQHPNTSTPALRYEIWQDLASKQREKALRQALLARVEQRFQDLTAISRELAGKSDEEMTRLWGETEPWYERLLKLPRDVQWVREQTLEGARAGYIRTLWSPIERSLAGLMSRLSPEQWAALRAGRQFVFSSSPKRGELPLPPDVLRIFRTSRPSLSPPGRMLFPTAPTAQEFEAEQRRHEREKQARWAQAEEYQVRFWFVPEAPGTLAFLATTTPVRGGKPMGVGRENPAFLIISHAELFFPRLADDPERRARLEQDPILAARTPFQPDSRPFTDPLFPGSSRAVRHLPEVLPELARAYGVNFIADSYWPDMTLPNLPSFAGTTSLFEVLDRLAWNRHTWDRRGTLIRFRNRNWCQARPSEIPLRHVRRWVALCDRLGALPLEQYAALASALTDRQIDTLPNLCRGEVFPRQLRDLADASDARHLLRLYGRLSPDQQHALREGKPLATAQIPAPLRPLILAALQRIAARAKSPSMDLETWTAGRLSLAGEPDVRIREQRGPSISYRLESAPAPLAAPSPNSVARFPVTRLKLQIHYGPAEPATLPLVVAADADAP